MLRIAKTSCRRQVTNLLKKSLQKTIPTLCSFTETVDSSFLKLKPFFENDFKMFSTEQRGKLFTDNFRLFFKNENGKFISPMHDIPIR